MIAIIGAGLTGLALAHELAALGVEHVVLEASDRAGGVIRSVPRQSRAGRVILEFGPQRARMTRDMRRLVDELEIGHRVLTAPAGLPLLVYAAGRLRRVPFSARDFLRTDLLTPAAKLRLLLEPFSHGATDDESVADYLIRKMGRESYERMLGPLYGGLYASDPSDMVVGLSLRKVLDEFGIGRSLLLPLLKRGGTIDPPPAISFDGGLQVLTDALRARHAERIRLRTAAGPLRRGAAGGWIIATREGDIEADQVVLTTRAGAAAELLRGAAPAAASRIDALVYNPLAVVHLSATGTQDALGFQVSLGEDLLTRGVTFNRALFDRPGLHTSYLGGARAPEIAEWPDDTIAARASAEFRRITGIEPEVLNVARVSMPAWDRSWSEIRHLRLPSGITIASNWMARPGIPGRLVQARTLAATLAAQSG